MRGRDNLGELNVYGIVKRKGSERGRVWGRRLIYVAQDGDQWRAFVITVVNLWFHDSGRRVWLLTFQETLCCMQLSSVCRVVCGLCVFVRKVSLNTASKTNLISYFTKQKRERRRTWFLNLSKHEGLNACLHKEAFLRQSCVVSCLLLFFLKGYIKRCHQTLYINFLRSSGYFTYHAVRLPEIPRLAHRMCFCFLYGSRKKIDYFPINY
jgi:hypothetical protein